MRKTKLPIRVNGHWAVYFFAALFIVDFLRFAWISWNNNAEFSVTLGYVFVALFVVTFLVFASDTLDADESAIYVNDSLGIFMIYWDEVIRVEINGSFYAFHGENKNLAINLLLAGKGKKEFQKYVRNSIAERNIPVNSLSILKWFTYTYMNTSSKVK
jgi:hypothetical protein